ncbi:MAG: CheR family methyltransferase [Leptospirillia bacterium]
MSPKLATATFDILRDLIAERCGIVYPDSKRASLESKLSEHVLELGLPDFLVYLKQLEESAADSALWQELFQRVSTNETYFHRNAPQIKVFSEVLVPESMQAQKGKMFRRLKIWSAACATGEEPYTLAMELLSVLGDQVNEWQPTIYATDIDRQAIESAKAGRYQDRAVAQVPPDYMQCYFRQEEDGYQVTDPVREMVTFKVLNFANDEEMSTQINMDIVFCRNVLIYFDTAFRKRVVSHLFNSLRPGGFLVIGHSESLRNLHEGFDVRRFPGTLVYQRPEA